MFSKVMESLEQNIRKQIDCKRPSNTAFASTKLASTYIKQTRWN